MRNIDKPVMVFNRSIEEINREREREAHKRPQKILDLKEGLAEFNFFSMLYNICSKMVINLVKTLDGWLCLLSWHYF